MNVYVASGIALAWMASVGASTMYGHNEGVHAERARWQARENQQLAEANAKIRELTDAARAAERIHTEALNSVSDHYQGELRDAKKRHDDDLAAVRDGGLRLRDNYAAAVCPDTGRVSETGTGASGHHAAGGTELSREATEFLLGLANEADQVARQLSACQAVIRADRK